MTSEMFSRRSTTVSGYSRPQLHSILIVYWLNKLAAEQIIRMRMRNRNDRNVEKYEVSRFYGLCIFLDGAGKYEGFAGIRLISM